MVHLTENVTYGDVDPSPPDTSYLPNDSPCFIKLDVSKEIYRKVKGNTAMRIRL